MTLRVADQQSSCCESFLLFAFFKFYSSLSLERLVNKGILVTPIPKIRTLESACDNYRVPSLGFGLTKILLLVKLLYLGNHTNYYIDIYVHAPIMVT